MVNWTADKDQIILKGIFKFHNIKSSGPLLEYLAKEIGGDCTPKAVSHRLTNIRNAGTARANTGVASPSPKSTPRPRIKATPKKKHVSEEVDSDEVLSPTAARGKRSLKGKAKPKYDEASGEEDESDEGEDDYVPMAKRVKAEPVEENEVFAEGLVEEGV